MRSLVISLFSLVMCSVPAAAIDRIGWSATKETMYIHGDIKTGDANLIAKAILDNKRKLRGVILNSPGGDVLEGAKLTDLIRGLEFDTGVTPGACQCMLHVVGGREEPLCLRRQSHWHPQRDRD